MEVRAVCHVHSEWSYDANWTLEELTSKFSADGYRVLMMTEHDRGFSSERWAEFRKACAGVTSDKILVVPGIEYSDAANQVHVLVWGDIPFLGESLPTTEMLLKVKALNGIAVWAHPSRRSAWQAFETEWSQALTGIELWNRKYDGWAPSQTAGPLLRASGAVPFVGLDFHARNQSFPLAMLLDMDGPITENTVLNCMRARRMRPRAFGMELNRDLFRRVVPALGFAEHARRTLASVAKRAAKRVRTVGTRR